MKIVNLVDGIVQDIRQSSDAVFAQKMLGDVVVIKPFNNLLFSPIEGEIIMIYDTLHAIGIKGEGIEILLHIGVDTVELKGNCFECFVKIGDRVTIEDPLINCDFTEIKGRGYDESIMLIVTKNEHDRELIKTEGESKKGDLIIQI